jgi:dihydrofolate reductase
MRRWTPEHLAESRRLLDAAKAAAKTPQEQGLAGMYDESLRLFENFMAMRRDLAEGRLAGLAQKVNTYREDMAKAILRYKPQYAFSGTPFTDRYGTNGGYFKAFYAQFDTALMGRKSYEHAGGGVSPFKTYVLSRTLRPGKHGKVTVLGSDALERVAALREEPGKDIWLWGGGEVFGSLAAAGLVDTVEIGLVPVLLGTGRKVMAGCDARIKLVERLSKLELPAVDLRRRQGCGIAARFCAPTRRSPRRRPDGWACESAERS